MGEAKKKKSMVQELGVDVEFSTKKLDQDQEESRLIKRIGEERAPDGQEYVGTVAIHYYIDKAALLKNRYEMSSITHIKFIKDINENLAALGLNNAVIEVRKHFRPEFEHKSTNAKDKRNDIITS